MTITLSMKPGTGGLASDAMFGGNALFHVDDVGDGRFEGNVGRFGLTTIRWPGGSISETAFDPADPDVPLAVSRGGETITVSPDKVMTFTEVTAWAASSGHALDVVVPSTACIKAPDANGFRALDAQGLADLRAFVRDALAPGGAYADARIEAFEIGNEYWAHMSASDYGRVADAMIRAVNAGIRDSGASYAPKILIQAGDGWGPDFKPGGENHALRVAMDEGRAIWSDIHGEANRDIIKGLGREARESVDGLVNHHYPNPTKEMDDSWRVSEVMRAEWVKAGMDLGLHMTEWNVKGEAIPHGVKGFTVGIGLIEAFETMLRARTEAAYVWPVNQNTKNDLGGHDGPDRLSAAGAAFKLLSENVRGLRVGELTIGSDPDLETSLFTGGRRAVLFMGRDDGLAMSDVADLRGVLPADPEDGSRLVITEKVIVRDPSQDPYVKNEAGAKIVTDATGGWREAGSWKVDLKPWEVSMIRIEWVRPQASQVNGSATVTGTAGDDHLVGTAASQTFYGGDGHDAIYGMGGDDTIGGGALGNDTLSGGDGNDWMAGNAGDDRMTGGNGVDTMQGGAGNDWMSGGSGDDWMSGGEGNDSILGDAGRDTILGGSGNDTLGGGADADVIVAGSGNDWISGGWGDDVIQAESGNDTILGGPGNDRIHGGEGADWIDGGDGNDALTGGSGSDTILGGAGDDLIHAFDPLIPGSDDGAMNVLAGGVGNDTLVGGRGADRFLFGGEPGAGAAGSDLALGGAGADVFVFRGASGHATIADWQDGVDRISFWDRSVDMSDLTFSRVSYGGHDAVRIDYRGDDGAGIIRVAAEGHDVTIASLTREDFIFA